MRRARPGRHRPPACVQVCALQPVSTLEFELAAMFVMSSEEAHHALARAHQPDIEPAEAVKAASQANNSMRQATSTLRALLRLQAIRRGIEADPKAFDRGARIEHTIETIMTRALADADPPAEWAVAALCENADPELVSSHELESRDEKIETPPRHPILAPVTAKPEDPRQSPPKERTVSHHDPSSHQKKIETPARHDDTPVRWHAQHLGPVVPLSDMITRDREWELADHRE